MKWFVCFAFLASGLAHAFPEMTRHGYTHCTACHISPNGAGILTAYGRSLSKETLSTWGREGEEAFLYGAVKPPEWLSLGGDFRLIQTHLNNSFFKQGRFFTMQADVEAAATIGKEQKWVAVATFGKGDTSKPLGTRAMLSRRHYLMYRATDEINVRAGRFYQAFGIRDPNHVALTKRSLGWDQGQESYNLEGSWLGDPVDVFVTLNLGRFDRPSLDREQGVALRGGYSFNESYKVGTSYFFGSNNGSSRHVFGPYAILGFSPDWFILVEADFQSASATGLFTYLRVDYEFLKGAHLFVTHEYGQADFGNDSRVTNSYGLGAQWFPRPHVELQGVWQKTRSISSGSFGDYAWFIFHYYL